MKAKIVLCVLGVIGFLALSATMGQAGGGPGVVTFSAFFECQNIQGATPVNVDVSIRDAFSEEVIHTAKVSTAQMVCRQVEVRDTSTSANLIAPPVGDRLKCYSIAVQDPRRVPDFLNFADVGFGAETDVRVSGSLYLCGTTTQQ